MSESPPSLFSLAGKRVLVIGGTRGIGRAIALKFAREGAQVIATYVRGETAAKGLAADAAEAGLSLKLVRADASSEKARQQLVLTVSEQFEDLSGLVFVAATGVHRPLEQLTERYFDFTYALNVKAMLAMVQAFAPKIPAGGSIVALSSEGAVRAIPQYALVGSSKAALESLCRHMAVELAPRGIRVNVLSPGTVQTDAWKALPDAEHRLAEAAARTPRGSLVSLDEVASAAQFLISNAASGLTGHTLVVDAGARIVGAG
ncbi:MAG TPA: SDR family oxidoreductase [Steroidobacteraceae bacterium]|nr:SDR family oxidoreductase [Steroidobacteraceae bacterium]